MPFQSTEVPIPHGLSFDTSPYELPENIWSDGVNVRFHNGEVAKMLGEESTLGTPPASPKWLLPFRKDNSNVWLWADDTTHYLWDGSTHTDISNAGGHANTVLPFFWQGDTFNGIAVHTNNLDPPQQLLQLGTNWEDLANWPANWTAKIIRPFKNNLFAFNLTVSGIHYPFRLMWSDFADPGLPPPNWDIADPASRSGDNNLAEHDGEIVDARSLRDQMIIYRENSVYACRFVGGAFSYQFYTLFESRGILNQGCIAEIPQGHFVVGPEDIYVNDGRSFQILGDQQVRDWFYNQLDSVNARKVFCEVYDEYNEVWICFPSGRVPESEDCDLALIFNYEDGTWTTRWLPEIRAAKQGFVESLGTPIIGPRWSDYPTEIWPDLDQVQWGGPTSTGDPTALTLLLASEDNAKFYQVDKTLQFDGATFPAVIERYGMHLSRSDLVKHITRLVPRIVNGPVNIFVGSEFTPGEGVFWEGPYLFTPGEDFDITCRVSGRYMALRIESVGDTRFRMAGFAAVVDMEGQR